MKATIMREDGTVERTVYNVLKVMADTGKGSGYALHLEFSDTPVLIKRNRTLIVTL